MDNVLKSDARPVEGQPPVDGGDRRMPARRRPRKGQRGLTLIEILVVVTILGIIASMVGITVANQLEDAKIQTTRTQIADIAKALDLFKIKFSKYPQSLNDLVTPPEGKKPIMESIPKDAWDNDYVYIFPGQHNPGKFDIQSKGPDGVTDNEDDITNWK